MTVPRARLEIIGKSKQEILLDHDLVSIGRGTDNTLVLDAPDVSRYQVEIAGNPDGYVITDLGSSYGTRVNDNDLLPRVPKPLIDGDIIRIGAFELRFLTGVSAAPPSPLQENTMAAQFLPSESTVVYRTPTAPVLHVTTPQWTRNFPLEQDSLILGRDPASDIVIDVTVVSGKHAQLRRCNDSYEIVDLGSMNGLTFEGHRINNKRLSDGDVIYSSC